MGSITNEFVNVTQPLISMCQSIPDYTELKAAADALSAQCAAFITALG